MADDVVRISMWSGPRNISTAMMRSFENREDAAVTDEPFYAHYLAGTDVQHPGRDEVLARYETDWRRVAEQLAGAPPGTARVWYQKQMTHHLLPHAGRDWFGAVTHCFLIRDPREVLLSYAKRFDDVTLDLVGFVQQTEIYDDVVARTGQTPPVIDARDVLEDPRGTLTALCQATGIPFSPRMLSWPEGPRDTDGIWASHWYAAVLASTGFAPYRPREGTLPPAHREIERACRPHYERLHALRLRR